MGRGPRAARAATRPTRTSTTAAAPTAPCAAARSSAPGRPPGPATRTRDDRSERALRGLTSPSSLRPHDGPVGRHRGGHGRAGAADRAAAGDDPGRRPQPGLLARARDEFPDVRVLDNAAHGRRLRRPQHRHRRGQGRRSSPSSTTTPGPSRTGSNGCSRRTTTRPSWPSAVSLARCGPTRRPDHLPPELDWIVGCTYQGQPTVRADVRNLWGCNMSVRREVFDQIGSFDEEIGRIGLIPLGREETELCIRIAQQLPGAGSSSSRARWSTTGSPRPGRRGPTCGPGRSAEGVSKAAMARSSGPRTRPPRRAATCRTVLHPWLPAASWAAALRGRPRRLPGCRGHRHLPGQHRFRYLRGRIGHRSGSRRSQRCRRDATRCA